MSRATACETRRSRYFEHRIAQRPALAALRPHDALLLILPTAAPPLARWLLLRCHRPEGGEEAIDGRTRPAWRAGEGDRAHHLLAPRLGNPRSYSPTLFLCTAASRAYHRRQAPKTLAPRRRAHHAPRRRTAVQGSGTTARALPVPVHHWDRGRRRSPHFEVHRQGSGRDMLGLRRERSTGPAPTGKRRTRDRSQHGTGGDKASPRARTKVFSGP